MPTSDSMQNTSLTSQQPELFVGLVGAVGTDLQTVYECLREEFCSVGYHAQEIRLSRLLHQIPDVGGALNQSEGNSHEDIRIRSHMDAGDQLRKARKDPGVLAKFGAGAVREIRNQRSSHPTHPSEKTVYIFNSIKLPEEVRTLRATYGTNFFLISIYSPKAKRIEHISQLIAKSHAKNIDDSIRDTTVDLIKRDENTENDIYGQNVRDAFPLADLFITEEDDIKKQLRRFVEILFGHPYRTPTTDEYAMFHAQASALRSADLSRQVGAIIVSDDAELIAAGCNEVPKAGGGKVWENRVLPSQDYRDFRLGNDANAIMKREIFVELFQKLKDDGWLDTEKSNKSAESLCDIATAKDENGILRGSRIASIIEYGRIVHAEMSALMEAARRGLAVKEMSLFCTTFPCHMCARHIIDAGIKRVVFIEPYPKSLTKDLYKRSVNISQDESDDDAVQFEPFIGVAPRRYLDFFTMPQRRKDDKGYSLEWKSNTAIPKCVDLYPTHIERETADLANIANKNVPE